MTQEEKLKLMNDREVFKYLSLGQTLKLIYWEYFNKRKVDIFVHNLYVGYSVKNAFKDAKNLSNESKSK